MSESNSGTSIGKEFGQLMADRLKQAADTEKVQQELRTSKSLTVQRALDSVYTLLEINVPDFNATACLPSGPISVIRMDLRVELGNILNRMVSLTFKEDDLTAQLTYRDGPNPYEQVIALFNLIQLEDRVDFQNSPSSPPIPTEQMVRSMFSPLLDSTW